MSMNVGSSSGDGKVMCDINTTPLIDVMLCLLITIIYNVPPMTHAVKLDMPQPTHNEAQVKPEVVQLEIDFDGTIIWNGTKVAGMEVLERYLRSAAAQSVQPEIHLLPDRRAKYGVVAKVLAAAQRHHMTKIGFVNTTEFRD
jgi:biopolymer transport protein ExbD